MRAPLLFLPIFALSTLMIASFESTAHAEDFDDMDADDAGKKKEKKEKKSKRQAASPEVREIVKGGYAKANVGGAIYLGNFSGSVKPGTSLGLSLGKDFVDKEKSSMAFEFSFAQGIHNGTHYTEAPLVGVYIQGDLRTYSITGVAEWSFYPGRRIGLGLRAGGGVLFSPLLMDPTYYQDEVLAGWGIGDPGYHNTPHPMGMGGPTFEYYTKLSHFSVGIDSDVFYAVGFDLGTTVTGTMKYTF